MCCPFGHKYITYAVAGKGTFVPPDPVDLLRGGALQEPIDAPNYAVGSPSTSPTNRPSLSATTRPAPSPTKRHPARPVQPCREPQPTHRRSDQIPGRSRRLRHPPSQPSPAAASPHPAAAKRAAGVAPANPSSIHQRRTRVVQNCSTESRTARRTDGPHARAKATPARAHDADRNQKRSTGLPQRGIMTALPANQCHRARRTPEPPTSH